MDPSRTRLSQELGGTQRSAVGMIIGLDATPASFLADVFAHEQNSCLADGSSEAGFLLVASLQSCWNRFAVDRARKRPVTDPAAAIFESSPI